MKQYLIINRLYSIVCHLSSVICSLSSVFRLLSSAFLYICRDPSTNQLLFMRNKPNFRKSQMNLKFCKQMAYENKYNWTIGENKPNSNPIYERPKSLAGKSGHTRFCSWSDLRLLLWESSSSINNQTLIYELKGETSVNHEKI